MIRCYSLQIQVGFSQALPYEGPLITQIVICNCGPSVQNVKTLPPNSNSVLIVKGYSTRKWPLLLQEKPLQPDINLKFFRLLKEATSEGRKFIALGKL